MPIHTDEEIKCLLRPIGGRTTLQRVGIKKSAPYSRIEINTHLENGIPTYMLVDMIQRWQDELRCAIGEKHEEPSSSRQDYWAGEVMGQNEND